MDYETKQKKILSTLDFGSFPGKIMFSSGYTFDEVCKILKNKSVPNGSNVLKQLRIYGMADAGVLAV